MALTRLEMLTHGLLISVSVVALYQLGTMRGAKSPQEDYRAKAEAFAIGTEHRGLRTECAGCFKVYVVVSSTCRFCLQQEEFYRHLSSQARVHPRPHVELRIVAADAADRVRAAFRRAEFDPFVVDRTSAPSDLPQFVTPTMVVSSGAGKIVYSHFGILDPEEQQKVLSLVAQL